MNSNIYIATQIDINDKYGATKVWSELGIWYNERYDIQGWGDCDNGSNVTRADFIYSAAASFKFDGSV